MLSRIEERIKELGKTQIKGLRSLHPLRGSSGGTQAALTLMRKTRIELIAEIISEEFLGECDTEIE